MRVVVMGAGLVGSCAVAVALGSTDEAPAAALGDVAERGRLRLARLIKPLAPQLLALPGCAGLTAARIFAETAGIERFRSSAAFGMHPGTAPVPGWTRNRARFRQRRVASHRHHPAPDPRTRPGTSRATHRRWQVEDRGPADTAPPPRRRRLPPTANVYRQHHDLRTRPRPFRDDRRRLAEAQAGSSLAVASPPPTGDQAGNPAPNNLLTPQRSRRGSNAGMISAVPDDETSHLQRRRIWVDPVTT